MSSRASENSPSSIPSPTYQWTKARWLYIMSYFLLMRSLNTLETATLFPIIVTFFFAWDMMSFSTRAAGVSFRPILNPVGHHSTKDTLLFCCVFSEPFLSLLFPTLYYISDLSVDYFQ